MAAGNSVNDEIKEQHQKMKGRSKKEQFAYFWEYYKVYVLVTVLVLIFGGSLVYSIVTQKDPVMDAIFLNTYLTTETELAPDNEVMAQDFAAYAGIDTEKELAVIDAMTISYKSADEMSYANIQKVMAMVSARTVDTIIADDAYIDHALDAGLFADLRDYFSEEQIAEWDSQEKILWKDLGDDDTEEEIPIGIDVRDSKYMLSDQLPAWFTVVSNAPHPENALKFLEYMMEE